MNITTLKVGPIETNCYILQDGEEIIIIDPGADAKRILAALNQAIPLCILFTHRHWDHISAVPEILEKFQIPLYVGYKDAAALSNSGDDGNGSQGALAARFLQSSCELPAESVHSLKEGDSISCGNLKLDVLETPGHSEGSICFYCAEHKFMFTGDTLFAGGSYGRTDFPSGSMKDMKNTLATKFVDIPDDVAILPGHGPRSRFKTERISNFLLR